MKMKLTFIISAALLAAVVGAGCDDDDAAAPADAGATPDGGAEAGPVDAGPPPVYVLVNEVYADMESTTYVNVLPSLDITGLDLTKAVEYGGGRAHVAPSGGKIFVAPPQSAEVRRFVLTDDPARPLLEDGRISFANLGVKSASLDEWGNIFISPSKAYLVNYDESTTVVWNPTTMEIVKEIVAPQLQRTTGDLDGSPAVVQGNRLYRTFYWSDWDNYTFSGELYLGVFDLDTDTLLELQPETRCPALGNRVARDEAGNFYFSNWIWNVGATLVKNAPPSCVLRLPAGATGLDPAWNLSYPALAEGRQGAMFNYLSGGKALVSVFHQERVTIAPDSDPGDLVSTDNWRLWLVDLASGTGAPLAGIEWNAGAVSVFQIDGRVFIFVPAENWSRTKAYELKGGQAVPAFEAPGWSYSFFRAR